MEKLSVRQQQVFDYISRYCTENGFCPSLADISQAMGLCASTAVAHVNALKKKKYVVSEYRIGRSLRPVDPEKPVTVLHSESGANDTAPVERRKPLLKGGDYAGRNASKN